MKLVLTVNEVKQILLGKINEQFATAFTDIKFDAYREFESATFEVTAPQTIEVTE
jgi:hypothetical protein